MRTDFFLNFSLLALALTLKQALIMGQKIWNLLCLMFPMIIFPDSFDSICFFVLVELNY